MKKYTILLGILAFSTFGTFAMEEGELTKKEAENLYRETSEKYNTGILSYNQYRTNMRRAIPLLGFDQRRNSGPLRVAVANSDYTFTQFLLKYGADASDAFDVLPQEDPEVRSLEELLKMYANPIRRSSPKLNEKSGMYV
jgi:hypothetical protein